LECVFKLKVPNPLDNFATQNLVNNIQIHLMLTMTHIFFLYWKKVEQCGCSNNRVEAQDHCCRLVWHQFDFIPCGMYNKPRDMHFKTLFLIILIMFKL